MTQVKLKRRARPWGAHDGTRHGNHGLAGDGKPASVEVLQLDVDHAGRVDRRGEVDDAEPHFVAHGRRLGSPPPNTAPGPGRRVGPDRPHGCRRRSGPAAGCMQA